MLYFLIHDFIFWIATSTADNPDDNSNCNKRFLASGVSTFFINGKPAVITGLRKFKNPISWPAIFAIFDKIPVFAKDLIALKISFILLFITVIPNQ